MVQHSRPYASHLPSWYGASDHRSDWGSARAIAWGAQLGVLSLVMAACATNGDVISPPAKSVALSSENLAVLGNDVETGKLRPASAFVAAIVDDDQRAAAIFNEMGKVFTHPRCVNCHPVSDIPLQGDSQTDHNPSVDRGPDGHGAEDLQCAACHGLEKVALANSFGNVPVNPKWALAPIEMGWHGKTVSEICQQLRDPARSNMTLEELHHHNAEDALVAYGWNPGGGREPAPGTQKEFGELTLAWIQAGAACPSSER
jgi:hypothetical protein